jgi:hypothetical protein
MVSGRTKGMRLVIVGKLSIVTIQSAAFGSRRY